MNKRTIKIEIPAPPKGWKYDGIRHAKYGERFLWNGQWQPPYSLDDSVLAHPVAVRVKGGAK